MIQGISLRINFQIKHLFRGIFKLIANGLYLHLRQFIFLKITIRIEPCTAGFKENCFDSKSQFQYDSLLENHEKIHVKVCLSKHKIKIFFF